MTIKHFSVTYTKDYASVLPRIVARLIDNLLLSFYVPVSLFYFALATDMVDLVAKFISFFVLVVIPMNIFQVLYYVLSISKYGMTLGNWITGLKITDEKENLLPWKLSAFRTLIAQAISVVLLGAGFWAAAFNQKHQGWHDLLTGSVVKKTANKLSVGTGVLLILIAVYGLVAYLGIAQFKANKDVMSEIETLNSASQELMQEVRTQYAQFFDAVGKLNQANPELENYQLQEEL